MQLSFVKTLQGHEIEFVRLMYPIRYHLFIRNANANPVKATMTRDEKGAWGIDETNDLPVWITEVSLQIQTVVEENEASVPA